MPLLQPLAPQIWWAEHEIAVPGGIKMPTRMTVVRLPGDELLLHSPIPATEALVAEVKALGRVAHLVAPCLRHHMFLASWKESHREARLYGVPGLPEKRSDLRFDEVLGDEAPAAWREVLEQRLIRGQPKLNEVVFLHRASRTLIVSELVFNILHPRTFTTGLALRAAGIHKKLAQSVPWRLMVKDRAAVRASLARMLAWDFDRVVMGHGEVLPSDGKRALQAVL